MSSYTEPLQYESTEIFRRGRLRPRVVEIDGEPTEVTELSGARRLAKVTPGFVYRCRRTGMDVAIFEGFVCDLGSIPAFARNFLSPDDPWAQAYVVHDWHYCFQVIDRKAADLVLWDALALPYRAYSEAGEMYRVICPAASRWLIYRAVRFGG